MALQVPKELFLTESDVLLNLLQQMKQSALQGFSAEEQKQLEGLKNLLALKRTIFTAKFSKAEPYEIVNGKEVPLELNKLLGLALGVTPEKIGKIVWKPRRTEAEKVTPLGIETPLAKLRALGEIGKAEIKPFDPITKGFGEAELYRIGKEIKTEDDLKDFVFNKLGITLDTLRTRQGKKYYNKALQKLNSIMKRKKVKKEVTKPKPKQKKSIFTRIKKFFTEESPTELEKLEKKAEKAKEIVPKTREQKLKSLSKKTGGKIYIYQVADYEFSIPEEDVKKFLSDMKKQNIKPKLIKVKFEKVE